MANEAKAIAKIIRELSHRHSQWKVFTDFVEMGACSISNAVDWPQAEKREAAYMAIVKQYRDDEVKRFPEMLALLVEGLSSDPVDVLGPVFHDLELHNKWTGQFFTPFGLCQMMASMTVGSDDSLADKIAERGFIRAHEPAAGSGAMVIAMANAMRDAGYNYQTQMHVSAIDVDAKCAHMTYLQLSLLHIPAVIVHGNTLSLEVYGNWYTPAHIMGGWGYKLKASNHVEKPEIGADAPNRGHASEAPIQAPPAPEPRGQLSLFF
jgi:hypothetical protein